MNKKAEKNKSRMEYLSNLSKDELKAKLCHDCYDDYILDKSTITKYQGGGEFLRYTWRLRKNIHSHMPGCPSRLISAILSKCWSSIPYTQYLFRRDDPRMCSHCGQLKRKLPKNYEEEMEYATIPRLKRYDTMKSASQSNFQEGSAEELEWILANQKYKDYTSEADLKKVTKKKKPQNDNSKKSKKNLSSLEDNNLENTNNCHSSKCIENSHSADCPNIPLADPVNSCMKNHLDLDLVQDTVVQTYNSKNILLCVLNNVSYGGTEKPDDSCVTSKTEVKF